MLNFIEYLAFSMLIIIFFQLYYFAIASKGVEKQKRCQNFGIVFTSLGIFCLIVHQVQFVVAGFILMMLGFRLIAHGLDRIDKHIFIDRHEEDR